MLAYITRRIVYGAMTLLALSMVVFSLLQMTGGGPLDRLKLNPRMQPLIAQLTEQWGLDRPIYEQYLTWLKNYLTIATFELQNALPVVAVGLAAVGTGVLVVFFASRWRPLALLSLWTVALWVALVNTDLAFNWGVSFQGGGDVWDLVFSRAGATFRLGLAALVISLIVGIPLGIYQAVRQYSFFDQVGTVVAFVAFSLPIFVVGIGLQIVFALYLEKWTGVKLFYVAGMNDPGYSDMSVVGQWVDTVQHLALPAFSIALSATTRTR